MLIWWWLHCLQRVLQWREKSVVAAYLKRFVAAAAQKSGNSGLMFGRAYSGLSLAMQPGVQVRIEHSAGCLHAQP
jgi:hypothetical protein